MRILSATRWRIVQRSLFSDKLCIDCNPRCADRAAPIGRNPRAAASKHLDRFRKHTSTCGAARACRSVARVPSFSRKARVWCEETTPKGSRTGDVAALDLPRARDEHITVSTQNSVPPVARSTHNSTQRAIDAVRAGSHRHSACVAARMLVCRKFNSISRAKKSARLLSCARVLLPFQNISQITLVTNKYFRT
jgi:hypothetical protein